MRAPLPLVLGLLTALGCQHGPPVGAARNPPLAPPVDPVAVPSVGTTAGWAYREQVTADLDGDGLQEQLTLTSDVTLDATGRPLWEDGHRWAVYVEGPARSPTRLYAAFVPNGHVEAAVLAARSDRSRPVLVHERTPSEVRVIEVEYAASGARLISVAHYQVEQWLQGTAPPQGP